MKQWLDQRAAAVLLHITSLPGPFKNGVLGTEAKTWIDRLSNSGFRVWQFLPLGPTHDHGSPYESLSSDAGNPDLLDLRECVEQGWLQQQNFDEHSDQSALRAQASAGFWQQTEQHQELAEIVAAYQQRNTDWLDDYTLFFALKQRFNNQPWWEWPQSLRDRDPNALEQVRVESQEQIKQCVFEQLLFDRQWTQLKHYAESKKIQLFGDLPIYVSHDSVDVWTNPELFTLNEQGLCEEVAGVPPDYFSETGQRWGNPLYQWDRLEETGFDWWVKRVKRQLERMHMLRIDHFRAFEAYWAIPGERMDGIVGEWKKAPGDKLLARLKEELGQLPFIAEDLGIITDEVTAMRHEFELPGMKILQFAFGGDDTNPYLPHNHEENSVVYTGTHDNDTTMGWFDSADLHTREHALSVLNAKAEDMPWAMIETAMASIARLAVIPIQDLLSLGAEARFNTPGTIEGNWNWRLNAIPPANNECWQHIRQLIKNHQRTGDQA